MDEDSRILDCEDGELENKVDDRETVNEGAMIFPPSNIISSNRGQITRTLKRSANKTGPQYSDTTKQIARTVIAPRRSIKENGEKVAVAKRDGGRGRSGRGKARY